MRRRGWCSEIKRPAQPTKQEIAEQLERIAQRCDGSVVSPGDFWDLIEVLQFAIGIEKPLRDTRSVGESISTGRKADTMIDAKNLRRDLSEVEINPVSNLAKMLHVIVQEIGAMQPQAFREIDVVAAIDEADRAALQANVYMAGVLYPAKHQQAEARGSG